MRLNSFFLMQIAFIQIETWIMWSKHLQSPQLRKGPALAAAKQGMGRK